VKKREESGWELIRTDSDSDLKLFRVRFDWVRNPRNSHTVKATVLEAPDWVNVIALTAEERLVIVHQYRFGTAETTTEIPAGIVEEGETSEDAAVRELKEETGYTTDEWKYLGYVEPNPAFLDNRCHHWLARNVVRTLDPEPDPGENLSVSVMDLAEIRQEISEGRLRHSLAITALSHIFDLSEILKRE